MSRKKFWKIWVRGFFSWVDFTVWFILRIMVRRKYLCCHIFVLFDCYLERWMGWWWMSSQIILCRPPKVSSVALLSQQDIQRIRSHSQTHRSTLNWVGTQLKRVSMLHWAWVHPSIMIIIGQLLNVLLLKTLRSMVKYIVSSGIGEKADIWCSSLLGKL